MAGRPVTVHGGSSGLLYGMIAFAIVAVAALVLFVLQLTSNKNLANRAEAAEKRAAEVGTPPAYFRDEASAQRTNVFAVLDKQHKALATVVTGSPEDLPVTMMQKAEQVLADAATRTDGAVNKDEALLSAVRSLGEEYARQKQAADTAAATVADLQRERDALTAQLKAQRDQFDAQVADLSGQLTQTQEEKTAALQQKDSQLREMQGTLDATEARLQTNEREGVEQVRDRDIQIAQLEAQIGSLQKQIQALKPGTFDPSAILTSADGRVLRAIPGSDIVYINLGAADKIKPGMGFEVYSPNRPGGAGLRGKASLEVVTAMEETAECRVTRREREQPILEGDFVVNVAYERNRQPKFVVRGDFDLNYDGTIDYDGMEQVTSLIRQWGGQVVDELDETVDFVVIGVPPSGPQIADDARVSAVVRDQAQQTELRRTQFRALVERAQKMTIPVITQQQFLFLTGAAAEPRVVQR